MTLAQLAISAIFALVLLVVSHRLVRRRSYYQEFEALGFAPSSEDDATLAAALGAARPAKRFGRRPARVRSVRRFGEGEGSIFHCLVVNGSGKNRSESFVFVVPRSGEGPESPVVVFANTTGNRITDALTSLGRVTFKGSRLGIPPWLTSTGIPCAISESGGDLESVLAPRELLCLAHAAESGFNMVEITGGAVILTVAENQYAATRQLDFAKRWLP